MRLDISKPLPPWVIILGVSYKVELVPDLLSPEGKEMDGHISYNHCVIKIDPDQHLQAQWQTLLHEIVHAILFQTGHEEVNQEPIVDALAYGILGVIQATCWELQP